MSYFFHAPRVSSGIPCYGNSAGILRKLFSAIPPELSYGITSCGIPFPLELRIPYYEFRIIKISREFF